METSWLDLEDKVVVVTGAAGGMGREICREFSKQKAKVVLLDLNEEGASEYAASLKAEFGIENLVVKIDTTNEEAVQGCLQVHRGSLRGHCNHKR